MKNRARTLRKGLPDKVSVLILLLFISSNLCFALARLRPDAARDRKVHHVIYRD